MAAINQSTSSKVIVQDTVKQHQAIFNLNALSNNNDGSIVDCLKLSNKKLKSSETGNMDKDFSCYAKLEN